MPYIKARPKKFSDRTRQKQTGGRPTHRNPPVDLVERPLELPPEVELDLPSERRDGLDVLGGADPGEPLVTGSDVFGISKRERGSVVLRNADERGREGRLTGDLV